MPKPKLPDKDFEWEPQLAYAVGLITTDGYLSSDQRHITLTSSDKELLETFIECLQVTNKISVNPCGSFSANHSYRVQVGDVQLHRWLTKIGLFPGKTYTLGELNIPDQYFPDFLRGWLDGDGSVFTYTDTYNTKKNPKYVYTRLYTKFISASRNHTQWLQSTIKRLLTVSGSLASKKPCRLDQRATVWELRYAKKESIKLLNWIYYSPNVPCLQRKRKIAEPYLTS